jgi:hypothetical protein
MLWKSNEFKQVVDTSEGGAIAVLADGACLVSLEDIEGEATQAGEHAGVNPSFLL